MKTKPKKRAAGASPKKRAIPKKISHEAPAAKPKPKKRAKADSGAETAPPAETAPATETNQQPAAVLNGVPVLGDHRRGGTAKRPIQAALTLLQIEIVGGLNPRSDPGDLQDLERSIKAEGILSPLLVRPSSREGVFELISGERRLRCLQNLQWCDEIPVLIRLDLEDDTDARAVAVAENETGTRLNPIEVGRVLLELQEKKWTIDRMAKMTGVHPQAVRRCLRLMGLPDEVQNRIATGALSFNAGIELAQIPEGSLEGVIAEIGVDDEGNVTAREIRQIRKELEKRQSAEEIARDVVGGDDAREEGREKKDGKSPQRAVTAWRSAREKQSVLQELCYQLTNDFDPSAVKEPVQHQIEGMIAFGLWDRGDLDTLEVPLEDTKPHRVFHAAVAANAAKHVPATESDEG